MTRTIVMGVARHVLTIASGVLVSSGYIEGNDAEMIIGGGMALFGVAWSALDKARRNYR